MEPCIKIKKRYLIFRNDAKGLIQLICKKFEKESSKIIFLDFAHVDFISRSFIDEFLNGVDVLEKKGIKIRPIYLKFTLKEFIAQVRKTRNKIRKELPE